MKEKTLIKRQHESNGRVKFIVEGKIQQDVVWK